MNIFEQSQEQSRHWSVMQDKALFVEERRNSTSSSEDKRDKEFSVAHITEEVPRQLHYFRRELKGSAKFYSLGGTARTLRGPNDNSIDGFIYEVEQAAFDDSSLIRMLNSMQQNVLPELANKNFESLAPSLRGARDFIEGNVEARLHYSDKTDQAMSAHARAQLEFQNLLILLGRKITFHRETLKMHPLFRDIDLILEQLNAILAICRDSKLNTSSTNGFITTELPEAFTDAFPENLCVMQSHTHNVYKAKALFLHHLGLVPHIKYFFTIASLIEYVEQAAEKDSEVQGIYPDIVEPDENGLVLDVEGFAHPAIYRGKPIRKHFHDIYASLGRDIMRLLEKDGLIKQFQNERRDSDDYWVQGVTHKTLESFIQRHDLKMGPAETLMDIYDRSAFFPFKDIHLSTRNRIQIVTGANFNGKSTYMQAIGYLFHKAATARKFIAESARISLPDMVFDDFDINAYRQRDISRERSTFSSQVQKIIEFTSRGTPRSIGLFDELYHGTSAPYLLSLGWATIEKFEQLGLYAIISTHEPLLTRFTEKNGYESLRGKYYRPPYDTSEQKETTVSNVSLQKRYELKHEPVTDSDAFRIARQEGMHEDVMRRAEEILRHITAKDA